MRTKTATNAAGPETFRNTRTIKDVTPVRGVVTQQGTTIMKRNNNDSFCVQSVSAVHGRVNAGSQLVRHHEPQQNTSNHDLHHDARRAHHPVTPRWVTLAGWWVLIVSALPALTTVDHPSLMAGFVAFAMMPVWYLLLTRGTR